MPRHMAECRHCHRRIVEGEGDEAGYWIDPEATGDDSVWRETCDEHDSMVADHEPMEVGNRHHLGGALAWRRSLDELIGVAVEIGATEDALDEFAYLLGEAFQRDPNDILAEIRYRAKVDA